jgi:purine-binding chemotaxis protein CheW
MERRATVGTTSSGGHETQYLTFAVGAEEYGIDILCVQEIKGHTPITPIPNSPAFIKGVMNLRGTVVPVIGLRETFGMEPVPYDRFSVIVVMNVGTKVVGMLVDAVSDVLSLKLADIDMAPELGGRVDMSFIQGMARAGEKFIVILAIEKLVAGVDIGEQETSSQADGGTSAKDRSAA